MENKIWRERVVYFFAGMLMLLACIILMGTDSGNPPVGRYQLEVVIRNSFPDLYVIDTSTGRVKWVDSKDENKPFEKIR